jgi:Leucine-rich repeat (LRR) protein
MIKKNLLTAATLLLLAIMASCNNRKTGRATSEEIIEFTFTGNQVTFSITAENISADWGDGLTETYSKIDSTSVVHTYTKKAKRTVRIRAHRLSDFSCRGQRLTALDVSNCTALTTLTCDVNQLRTLNTSGCTALTSLSCGNNRLSALDVSGHTALTRLECGGNQLSAEALDAVFADLPDRQATEAGNIWIGGNPGANTCNRNIATARNWGFLGQ